MDIENPVSRFFEIASKVKKSKAGRETSAIAGWSEILGVGKNEGNDINLTDFWKRWGLLYDLFGQAKATIESSADPRKKAIYVQALSHLKPLIEYSTLQGNFENIKQQLNAQAYGTLQLCVYDLTSIESERSSKDLAEIQNASFSLKERVINANIDSSLKAFIIEQLSKIDAALADCRIRGPIALMEAIESTAGAVMIRTTKEQWENDANSEEVKGFWALIGKIDAFLGEVGQRYPRLTAVARNLLPAAISMAADSID